jgi:predicted ATPase
MSTADFGRLPQEYLQLLQLAHGRHGIDVVPLHALTGGRTGAFLYLVSVSAGDLRRLDHLVLKLDKVNAKSRQTEMERHRLALDQAPPSFAAEHIADLAYELRERDAIALFYGIAGQSLQRYRTLASLESQSKLVSLFEATHRLLLREWNAEAAFERALHPRELLQRWLGYRLAPDSPVGSLLREGFQIDPHTEGFLVQGQVYPNPLAFGLDAALWDGARPIDALIGFQHGDLNIGNILAEFPTGGEAVGGFFLIDFALYKAGMPLLYDLCYLEMSFLTRELDRAPLETWVTFVEHYATSDRPDPKEVPVELSGACAVLNAGRATFDRWAREVHPSVADDLWGQYRLAAVAAGLNFCNKSALPTEARLAALVYSAAHLKRFCLQFGVPLPVDVRPLYDATRWTERGGVSSPARERRHLPVPPTPFVGREADVTSLKALLLEERIRLLTLTGPGGIGKTRLALRLATELSDHFEDGICFVDLANVTEPDAVLPAVARALGVRETSERPLLDELVAALEAGRTLPLLDNFEQVTAAAPVLGELLARCPGLKLLVTSREALHTRGEHVYPVAPLAMPGIDLSHLSVEGLVEYDAVRLFVERARAADPAFEVTDANTWTLTEICARLDGLPLAIELAAARLSLFSPQALLDRLRSRLKLLRGGARDLPERQQTLRSAIDWSYDLLDDGEKRLLAVVSVFQGCTLEAVEAVIDAVDHPDAADIDALGGLASLVDKSLLQRVRGAGGEPRLRMLETIREYAAERLDEQPVFAAAARLAHAAHYAGLAEQQAVRLAGAEREATLTGLEADVGNLQSAWRHWVSEGDLERLHELTDCLWLFYDSRGWYQATVDLTTDLLGVLATTPSTPDRIEQEILLQTSLARAQLTAHGYTPEAEKAYSRALELCELQGEMPQLFPVLRGLSTYYSYRAEFDRAVDIGKRILDLADRLGDAGMKVEGHLVYGYCLAFDGHLNEGLQHLEQSIAASTGAPRRTRRFRFGAYAEVTAHIATGLVHWLLGFPDRALEHADAAQPLADASGHPFTLAYARFHSGLLHLWRREPEAALARALSVLEIADEHAFLIWTAVGTCLRGAALAGTGRAEEGLEQIRGGMTSYQTLTTRPPVFWPMLLAMEAGVAGQAGQLQDGLALLEEAMGGVEPDARNVLSSDLCRLRAELVMARSPEDTERAETWLQKALVIAEKADARLLALRAATSLYRMHQRGERAEEARHVLEAAHQRMTEGFATADVRDAEALLHGGA